VVLTGCTSTGNELEAWIYNRLTNENKVYRVGDSLDIGGVKGKLLNIAPTGIVLEMDSKECSLKLGKNLRDLKELPARTALRSPEKEPETDQDPSQTQDPPVQPESQSGEDGKPEKVGVKTSLEQSNVADDQDKLREHSGS
jgi:hypothetical protein